MVQQGPVPLPLHRCSYRLRWLQALFRGIIADAQCPASVDLY